MIWQWGSTLKSEHWAPCHIQTLSRYDWKIVESEVKTKSNKHINKQTAVVVDLILHKMSIRPILIKTNKQKKKKKKKKKENEKLPTTSCTIFFSNLPARAVIYRSQTRRKADVTDMRLKGNRNSNWEKGHYVMCEYRRPRTDYTSAYSDRTSLSLASTASKDNVSWQRRSWSDCSDVQTDLGIRSSNCHRTTFLQIIEVSRWIFVLISPWKHILWRSFGAPRRGDPNGYHSICFDEEMRKISTY